MALDVYFREDIANVLRSVNMAGSGKSAIINAEIAKATSKNAQLDATELTDRLEIYEQGYRDALRAVATAFGIATHSGTMYTMGKLQLITQGE